MRRVLFITSTDARFGFGLAGASQWTASAEDVSERLAHVKAEPDIGLVAIDERLLPDIPEELLRELDQKWEGIVVVLPAPDIPGTKVEDYALELIRRTIGYHLRLSP